MRTSPAPARLLGRIWSALPLVLSMAVILPGLVAGQATDFESPVRLNVTSNSAAAAESFWIGLDHAENLFPNAAREGFEEALRLDPEFGMAHVVHGAFSPRLTREERDEHIAAGFALLADAPTVELLTALGLRARSNGNQAEARTHLESARKLAPGDPHLAFWVAQATNTVDGPQAGIGEFRKVTQQFPDYAPAWNILAYQSWRTGDREGALQAVQTYVGLASDHRNGHDSFAEILQWAGRWNEAAGHYQQAIEIDPGYQGAFNGLAELAQLRGDGEAARSFLARGAEAATTPTGALNARRAIATSFFMDGDVDEALELLGEVASEAQAAELTTPARLAHQQAALVSGAVGNADEAEAHLSAAWDLGGENTPLQAVVTAVAMADAGDLMTAREAHTEFADAVGDQANWQSLLSASQGVIAVESGDFEGAAKILAVADPDFNLVQALLAESHDELGNESQARNLAHAVVNDGQVNLYNIFTGSAWVRAAALR